MFLTVQSSDVKQAVFEAWKEYCGEQTIARKAAKNLTPATIIHPWGRLRMSLDFLAALFIMYDCFMIPMILGFEQYEEPRPLSVLTLMFWTFAMFFLTPS